MWPSLAMIAGGIVNIAIWPVFTNLHGPTSFNEQGEFLGAGALFWGSMMEGPSGLLIALGLIGSYGTLTRGGGRIARIGFWLAIVGAIVPAVVNLAIVAVMPPLLTPVFGLGLLLIAVGNRRNRELSILSQRAILGLAVVLLFTFTWSAAVGPDLIDRIDGYRIQGIVANVLFGLGWVVLGASLLVRRTAQDTSRRSQAS